MRETKLPRGVDLWASVLLTYPRRPFLWALWPVAFSAAAFASSAMALQFLLRGAAPPAEVVHDNLLITTMFLCVTCTFIASGITEHSSRLLVLPGGALVPRLTGPVIGLAVLFTFCAVAIPPLLWPRPLMATAAGRFPLHAGAVAAVIAAEGSWLQLFPRFAKWGILPILAALAPWSPLIFRTPRRILFDTVAGGHPGLVAVMYGFAGALFIALWVFMGKGREWPELGQSSDVAGGERGRDRRLESGPAAQPLRVHCVVASPWRRFRLRRVITAGGMRDGVCGVAGGALMAIAAIVVQRVFEPADVELPALLSLIITVVAPIAVASRVCVARAVLLTHEFLLPQPRPAVFRGIGLAALSNLLALWVAGQFGLLATFAVLAPQDLRSIPGTLGLMLGAGVAFQIYFFGTLAWYVSFRPNWITGAVFGALSFSMIPVGVSIMDHPAAALVGRGVAMTIAIAIAGVVLAATAYVRWSRSEIA